MVEEEEEEEHDEDAGRGKAVECWGERAGQSRTNSTLEDRLHGRNTRVLIGSFAVFAGRALRRLRPVAGNGTLPGSRFLSRSLRSIFLHCHVWSHRDAPRCARRGPASARS